MNTELRTKTKNDFQKDFFKLMKHSALTTKNVRKHGDISLLANE